MPESVRDTAPVKSRHVPVQQRSRARVEAIIHAATELLGEGGVDALTMRSVAERTGIPVASIYRYFDNRDAIIAAYLDRELEAIEASQRQALMALKHVTFRAVSEAAALAHMRHHQEHQEGVPVWFGGRLNPAVVERVRLIDARLAESFQATVRSAGMMADVPDFMAELLVRLFDRMFEYAFLTKRSASEREAIVLAYVDMISTYMERFATPAGRKGISAEEFVRRLAAVEDGEGAAKDATKDGAGPRGRSKKKRT